MTLWVACRFYSSLRLQTLYSRMFSDPSALALAPDLLGDWSAPLDDVFIHFDFARSTARGYPFEWSEGNGFSSGGTSWLYPFVLAFGYWVGFRRLELMVWAGVVACVSVFALLLASRRLFAGLPRWTSYLAPPALLCVGALDWSLFSGMEVAVFLALFGGALITWDDLARSADSAPGLAGVRVQALLLGLIGVALVATRPEAVTTVAVLGIGAALVVRRRGGFRRALGALLAATLPAVGLVIVQQVLNRALTGDASAAGAVTKLELYHPHLSVEQIFDAWWFHTKYQVLRLGEYHMTERIPFGWIPWLLALIALFSRATRRSAALLWASAGSWIVVVGLNGQVRWQNERYTMPATAWIMLAAALGLGVLFTRVRARGRRGVLLRTSSAIAGLALALSFLKYERLRFIEQVWFFGRASRNILDQHVRAGKLLRHNFRPPPRRVLVGDAGAIPYASDLPALDIIGLGGYRALPFARATQLGVGASIELIERLSPEERPDVMAIYPHWWDALPIWFGKRIPDGSVTVRGNVICAGASKVLYQADWSPLASSARPLVLSEHERIVDSLDFADLVDEREHGYRPSPSGSSRVEMKLLAHPARKNEQLWDAGRATAGEVSETFALRGFTPARALRLLFRVAPAQPITFAISVDGERVGEMRLGPSDEWIEPALEVPASRVRDEIQIQIEPSKNERTLYHLWAVQPR